MKKYVYIVIGLLIFTGIAFAFSQSSLLQGKFDVTEDAINQEDDNYVEIALDAATKAEQYENFSETAFEKAEVALYEIDYLASASTPDEDAMQILVDSVKEYVSNISLYAKQSREWADVAYEAYLNAAQAELLEIAESTKDWQDLTDTTRDTYENTNTYVAVAEAYDWINYIDDWQPNVEDWGSLYTEAEDFYEVTMTTEDYTAFTDNSDYRNFMITIYVEMYNSDSSGGYESALGMAYDAGLISFDTFQAEIATNTTLINSLSSISKVSMQTKTYQNNNVMR